MALAADVGAVVLPGVPAVAGVVARGGKAIAHVDDAARLARIAVRTERFASVSPEIGRGVEWLAKIVESPDVFPPFRYGLEKQLKRAEMLYEQGKLQGVEVLIGKGRVDFALITGELVEFKYWRENYARTHIEDLLGQIQRYRAGSREMILEFGRTKTNPVTEEFIEDLLKRAKERGIPLTREQIRIIDLE